MAKSIDERIVDMKFNNAQFEKKVKNTIDSLDKLDKSLEFKNAKKGFRSLEKASDKVDLSGISRSVEKISNGFSALGAVGFTVIQNLTNSALNMAKKVTSALTVTPVLDGLSEYELKMNSIQTILTNTASKGTTLDQVNEALNTLNKYADKTIYNFAQMTDNVGRFTAAGLGLDEAVTNIKGLANLAAGTGVENARMVGAAQQISQALQNPYFIAQDWFSVTNAGLGGELLQNGLRETAKQMGVVIDTGKSFKDSLRDGWLTAEVWTETMRKMSEDDALLAAAQNVTTFTKLLDTLKEAMGSGWAGAWEAVLGGKEQSTRLWTGISNALGDVIGAEADARIQLFKFWNEQGGRQDVLIGIGNILNIIGKAIEPIERGFRTVFKPISGDTLVNISKRFRELSESFKIGEGTANNLQRTFAGLFAIVNIGLKTINLLGRILTSLLGTVLPVGDGLLGITAILGDLIVNFDKGIFVVEDVVSAFQYALDILSPAINKIVELFMYMGGGIAFLISQVNLDAILNEFRYLGNQIKPIAQTIKNDLEYLASKIKLEGLTSTIIEIKDIFVDLVFAGNDLGEMFRNIGVSILTSLQSVTSFIQPLAKIGGYIYAAFAKIGQGILFVWQKVTSVISAIKQSFIGVGDGIKGGATTVLDSLKSALDYIEWDKIEKLLKGSLLASIILVFRKFMNSISTFLEGGGSVFGPIVEVLESVKDTLETYQNTLKANILLKLAGAIAILTVSLLLLSSIDPEKLKASLIAMGFLITGLIGGLKTVNKFIDSDAFTDMAKAVTGMVGLAFAVFLLTSAVKKLAKLDIKELSKGVGGVIALLGAMTLMTKYIDKNITRIAKASTGMILFGVAVNVLVTAVKRMSGLKWDELLIGLGGVIGIMGGIVGLMKFGKIGTLSIKAAVAIGIISLAISRLTGVVGSLGRLKPDELYRGLAGVLTLLTAVSAFMLGLDKIGDVSKAPIVIFSISTSILIMGFALKQIASMPWDELGRGVSGMAATLGLFISTMLVLKKTSMSPDTALSMVIMAGSLLLVGVALKQLSLLTWTEIGIGLTVMTATLAIFAGITKLSSPMNLATGASMLLMATSMFAVGIALEKLGNFSWEQIGKGLTAMLGALALFSAASYIMVSTVGGAIGIAVMAGALSLMVPALLALSTVNIKGVGAGIALLAGTLATLAIAGYALAPLIPTILGLAAGITLIGVGVGVAGAGLALLTTGLVALSGAIFSGGLSISFLVDDLLPLIPKAVGSAGDAINVFIEKLTEGMPKLGELIKTGITTMLDVISNSGGELANTVAEFVLKLLMVIDEKLPDFLETGLNILLSLMNGISNNISELVSTGAEIVANYIKGITSKIGDIVQAGAELYIAFVNGLAEAIRKNKDLVIDAWLNVIGALFDVSKEEMEQLKTNFIQYGKDLVGGLVEGVKSLASDGKNAILDVGEKIQTGFTSMFGIQSPSKWFLGVGKFFMEGLGLGVEEGASDAINATTSVGKEIQQENNKIAQASGKSAKEAFEAAVEWINERKFYNMLTLQEEHDAWLALQKEYKDGSEERKKIDREVYTLRQKLAEQDFKNSKDWIDKKKYYNELSLNEELKAWRRVQKRYIDGEKDHVKALEERATIDKEIFRIEQKIADVNKRYQKEFSEIQESGNERRIELEEEYYDRTKEINDKLQNDILSLSEKYEDAVDARTDALYRAYNLFDKVNMKEAVSGDELLVNLTEQVYTMQQWREEIDALASRDVDLAIIDELQQMGPTAIQEIRALNTLSDTDLSAYVNLWRTKHREARNGAILELSDLKAETVSKIDELTNSANDELSNYRTIWAKQLGKLKEEIKTNLVEIKNEWLSEIGDISSTTDKVFLNMMNRSLKRFNNEGWSTLGEEVITGIVTGAASKERLLNIKMGELAKGTLTGFADALEIKSPSKAFARLGEYSVEGFIEGLQTMRRSLVAETENIATSVKETLKNALQSAYSMVLESMDLQPVIRPVLDLSNVQSGISGLNKVLTVDTASIASRIPVKTYDDNKVNTPTASNTVTFTQNNYSPKALSRMEIYRQTRNQISTIKEVTNPI